MNLSTHLTRMVPKDKNGIASSAQAGPLGMSEGNKILIVYLLQ
jgi:hypothetical protein